MKDSEVVGSVMMTLVDNGEKDEGGRSHLQEGGYRR